ncbi:TraK domain-containing protein [Methylomonas fluvii]|uniref:Type-F conjugative transfer system secretin TraK n=1 Tax=Methylomonas fluvii TaxID=1854564 RepID=A0ABR9DHP8_9GAMM|nr:type-F conjugative transfer system secretin TraK [Methylomonas fluvii]MBD9362321.1 type-F conjugative transfer system secretin TraK [Methylomonas fluvii]CAD6875394.1 IncF plasmid conjugative transfer pilus assembly protein TraK [Methylomonas fluvii]
MNKTCRHWALLLIISSTASAEELPITVLPPVTTVGDRIPESAEPSSDSQSLGIELPPVDASVLKAANQQVSSSVAPQNIQVKPGINELMPIAVGHLNRLVTPFDNPVVTTTSQATTSTKGKIVYVATTDETPVTLYITPGDNQDIALSLTLIPKRIPAREIHLSLDKDSVKVLTKLQQQSAASGSKASDQEQAYITQLKKLFRDLGLQKTPAGYALREPSKSEHIHCLQDKVQIRTGQVLEGQDMLILVGLARNTSSDPLELDERACATSKDDVLAVAAWPKVVLGQNESTELYIAVRREPESESTLRPSLLTGGQR